MRKFMISLAAAGTALAFATPGRSAILSAAQPAPCGYNGYGNNGWGQVRALQARIDNLSSIRSAVSTAAT